MDTIAGMPISRATIAECDSRLPRSTSSPAAEGKSMIQPGSVLLGDEDLARLQVGVARVGDDPHLPADDARAAADALEPSPLVVPACASARDVLRW